MTLLAHISDLHLNGTPRATERLERAMDHLRALPTPPDALLVTGDIADHGEPDEYREAARLLQAPFPVLACPGNHDSRSALRTALLHEPSGELPVNHAHRIDDLTVLMCDSTIPGRDDGELAEETLAWIDQAARDLDQDNPAVLVFHHPPVPVHHPMPDSAPLRNRDALAALLARNPSIIAVLGGHAHTAAASAFAGRPCLIAPAITWTLVMPPRTERLADRDADPGVAFHAIENGHITSHFRTVPRNAGS
jgi:3',5'-cyclic-AMP phosphodiesterase